MKNNRLFKLDNRLLACSKFVPVGANIVDVGTDHAYLPIWLAKNNIINHAIASDLREGPLLNAKNNIEKYGLSSKIETRLSDGLNEIAPNEVDTVIIAGMGGEIIAKILENAPWLKDSKKNIILQPMSQDELLRNFLRKENFLIKEEIPVLSHNKIYSVINAHFSQSEIKSDPLYEFIGKINSDFSNEANIYITKKVHRLKNQLLGLKSQKNIYEYERILYIIRELEKRLERNT